MIHLKTFLFLQGPHGPFFKLLGRALSQEGYKVLRINFNAGDFIDYSQGLAYKHSIQMWPEWIYNFVKHNKVTDVVLYGDCRPLHKLAILILKTLDVKVHVFEEGYIRPNWVTYELEGVNGHSTIKSNIDEIISDKKYDQSPDTSYVLIKHNMRYLLRYCIRYYFFKWLGVLFFPRYQNHRPVNSFYEALIWVKRYFTLKYLRRFAVKKFKELSKSKAKYYLFLMQLNTDYQIREHSPYKSMKQALIEVIYSFANHVPSNCNLVIKNHPLDSGQKNYSKLIKNIGKELKISERLIYLDGGNLPKLLDHSLAVITVNSTAGLQAIHHKKPLKILGTAIYDSSYLVNRTPLEDFWTHHKKPKQKAYNRFRNYLLQETQLNGSFYDPEGIKVLLSEALKKLVS